MRKVIYFTAIILTAVFFLGLAQPPRDGLSDQLKRADTCLADEKYAQAESIYRQVLTDAPADSNEAFAAQRHLVRLYILSGDQAAGDLELAQLTGRFSTRADLPGAIWQIGQTYSSVEEYERAEQVHRYNVANYPHDTYAMWSQVEIVYSYIDRGGDAAAAYDRLLAVFAAQPTLPKEIYQIAKRYQDSGKQNKAIELYQYNVERFPSDMYAMCSQVDIIYSNIDRKDNTAADAAFDKLLALFADQPTLPKEIHQIAMKYSGSGQAEKAYSLHQYNVEHFPDYNDLHVIWSQSELVRLDLQEGRYESACAGADKLLGWPPDQNDLPREIHVTAKRFAEAGKHDKACELYLHNVDHFPTDMYAMWSQVEIVYFHIRDGNDAAADDAFDKLLTAFADQPTLPKEIYQVGDQYAKARKYDKAAALYQHVIANWPGTEYEMWARTGNVRIDILAGNQTAVEPAIDTLIADFNDQPELATAIFSIAEQYFYQEDHASAIELWEFILNEYPESSLISEIPFLLGHCYEVIDEWQTAVKYYKQVVEEYPNSRYAHRVPLQIGVLCRLTGEYGEALYWLKQQRELYSEKQQAQWALFEQGAVYRLDLKDYQKAAEVFQQYISEYTNDEHTWPSYHGLAECYENTGNKAQAIAVLQEALERLSEATYADQIRYEYLREELQRLQEGGK